MSQKKHFRDMKQISNSSLRKQVSFRDRDSIHEIGQDNLAGPSNTYTRDYIDRPDSANQQPPPACAECQAARQAALSARPKTNGQNQPLPCSHCGQYHQESQYDIQSSSYTPKETLSGPSHQPASTSFTEQMWPDYTTVKMSKSLSDQDLTKTLDSPSHGVVRSDFANKKGQFNQKGKYSADYDTKIYPFVAQNFTPTSKPGRKDSIDSGSSKYKYQMMLKTPKEFHNKKGGGK